MNAKVHARMKQLSRSLHFITRTKALIVKGKELVQGDASKNNKEKGKLTTAVPQHDDTVILVPKLFFVWQVMYVLLKVVKWNHIVIWHAAFWLLFRKMPYLLNFSQPL